MCTSAFNWELAVQTCTLIRSQAPLGLQDSQSPGQMKDIPSPAQLPQPGLLSARAGGEAAPAHGDGAGLSHPGMSFLLCHSIAAPCFF